MSEMVVVEEKEREGGDPGLFEVDCCCLRQPSDTRIGKLFPRIPTLTSTSSS
jgi:hypothetical protein